MRTGSVRARAARALLISFPLICVAVFLGAYWDPGSLVEAFWEERAEQRYLQVWQRQASDVTWMECRTQPDLCPGKFVVWKVTRPSAGVTCVEGNCARRIVWSNEEQVPGSSADTMTAVGRVLRVEHDALVLVFLGSPDAPYGGTTRPKAPAEF